MKRTLATLCAAAALATTAPLQAQTTPNPAGLEVGGLIFNHDQLMAWDFASLSRTQNFGSARAMAMGGAFASLGADITAMSLNPAGLGMYRQSEFALTPLLSIARSDTPGTQSWSDNGRTRFAFANIGAAINVFQSAKGGLTNVTIGFGMNRIADFNRRYSYSAESRYEAGGGPVASMADLFADQLQKGTWSPGSGWTPILPKPTPDGPNGQLDFGHPYFWPATLAYKGTLIHIGQNGRWERDAIGHNASIRRSLDAVESGSINEFDISAGFNIDNVLYLGATLGIQSVSKRSDITYGEDYGYFNGTDGHATDAAGNVLPVQLDWSDLWQRTTIDGSGVNFKVGAIVRPVAGLRLGVAYHSPTFYSLDWSYRAGLEAELLYNDGTNDTEFMRIESPVQAAEGGDRWSFVSPSRLMFGASYAFGRIGILSVDYERNWYNGIRVKHTPTGADFSPNDYKAEFKSKFRAANTLRAGLEVRPLPNFALRAGGGYSSSMLKDESLGREMPLATESYYLTAGAGVALSPTVTLDLAYQYLNDTQSSYALFYNRDADTGRIEATSGLFDTSLARHYIALTLGFRF